MSTSYASILRSPLFTFLVGKDKEPVGVHSEAIASLSPALNTLINGSMIEAEKKLATFDDEDVDTFLLLCEYAYTGDYEPPSGIDKSDEGSDEEKNNAQKDNSIENRPEWNLKSEIAEIQAKHSSRTPTDSLRRLFQLFEPTSGRCVVGVNAATKSSPDLDYTTVFLSHARLYSLADKWRIDKLKRLTRGKLYKTLGSLKLTLERVNDVVELIRFVYDDDNIRVDDRIRTMVLYFVASKYHAIRESENFDYLLADGGQFTYEFWKTTKQFLL